MFLFFHLNVFCFHVLLDIWCKYTNTKKRYILKVALILKYRTEKPNTVFLIIIINTEKLC